MTTAPLSDREIADLCAGPHPLISPFVPRQEGKPSYGLGSFGYDIRLGARFLVPDRGSGVTLDPQGTPAGAFREVACAGVFKLAPGTFALGESVERFALPSDVLGLCFGKSSYARCGLVVNVTPLEPGWRGVLTMALINTSPLPIRLHTGQGIAQVVFFRGERPSRTYGDKEAGGAYQDQTGLALPR
ncbi:dCTP deaminase [Candidatus Bipolaricaulota bacterium]|nr:dCTP deaminase [Candidatus Bipolaricaulota bacterium]